MVPPLRRIAEITGEAKHEGLLGRALAAFDSHEAEQHIRHALDTELELNDYRHASASANDLANLLRSRGQLPEALELADKAIDYGRSAGLGPWTELLGEGQRLIILGVMGRAEQVSTEVKRLRSRMATLPDPADNEMAVAWNVREGILDTGRRAAAGLKQWQLALDLNSEISASQKRRNAPIHEQAFSRYNDYEPLLQLGKLDNAQQLLLWCQGIFADAGDTALLAITFTGRAHVEATLGHPDRAIELQSLALRYGYVQPEPLDLAIQHHNLAGYLADAGCAPADQAAHRLAAALLKSRTGTLLPGNDDLEKVAVAIHRLKGVEILASFAQVQEIVEQVEGVRLLGRCGLRWPQNPALATKSSPAYSKRPASSTSTSSKPLSPPSSPPGKATTRSPRYSHQSWTSLLPYQTGPPWPQYYAASSPANGTGRISWPG